MIAAIEALVSIHEASIEPVKFPSGARDHYAIDALRLDKIHAIISGNKWFKLKYSLLEAMQQNRTTLVTVGGAYSNHLLATACASGMVGLQSIGIVRGESPVNLSCTLKTAKEYGMVIEFLPRATFADKRQLHSFVRENYPHAYFIEEGGASDKGITGAQDILTAQQLKQYDYVCCAIGTGTTMAGIVKASRPNQQVLGIGVLKIPVGINPLQAFLKANCEPLTNFEILYDYHFGGYAKFNSELINFMNTFYTSSSIPTDFVYTAKLFYAINDLTNKRYFRPGSSILVIHSGGLQGNCSLPTGTLLF
jgi:1-aminocyclopropane-1-carboxylate deaminase